MVMHHLTVRTQSTVLMMEYGPQTYQSVQVRPLHDICNRSPCYIFTFSTYTCVSSSFLVACPGLHAPSHGTLSSTAIYPGVVILVLCDTGYTLKGIANVTCLVNGSWSHALPLCQQSETS